MESKIWEKLLEELEEWFENGTESFEKAHEYLLEDFKETSNIEEEAIIMKKLRIIGFLRGVICWHHKPISSQESSQSQSQSPPKDPQ
jgi:hypothetical protein